MRISGATGNGMEMQLPRTAKDREQWRLLGYDERKVIDAWMQIVDAFADAFPGKPLDLNVHPVLGSDKVAKEVADYGAVEAGAPISAFLAVGSVASRPGKIGTTPACTPLPKHLVSAVFLTFRRSPASHALPGSLVRADWRGAIAQGAVSGARYFEIWETDAMDPRLQSELREMARHSGPLAVQGWKGTP